MASGLPFRDAPNRGRGGSRGRGNIGGGDTRGGRGDSGGGGSSSRGRGDFRGGRGGTFRGGGHRDPIPVFTHPRSVQPIVDKTIIKQENTLIARRAKGTTAKLPSRPGYGTRGQEVVLWANYFQLKIDKPQAVYRYNIDVKGPDRKQPVAGKLAKRVIEILIEEEKLAKEVVSDFRATILALKTLATPSGGKLYSYRDEAETEAPEKAKQYLVTLTLVGTLSLASLLDESTSTHASSLLGARQEMIQALNILVGHHAKADPSIASLSNNRHYEIGTVGDHRMSLGAGLEAIRGFFFSVRAATNRLLVNVQVKNMAFYEPGPLEKIASSFVSVHGNDPRALLSFLKSLRVEVTHIKKTDRKGHHIPRFKTIRAFADPMDGKDLNMPPRVARMGAGPGDVQFYLQNTAPATTTSEKKGKGKGAVGPSKVSLPGGYISVRDFFRQQYNIQIENNALPVLNVGSLQEPSYLPMKVCIVHAGQAAKAKLSPSQTQQMIRFAVRRPFENATSIVTSGAKILGLDPNDQRLTQFGVSVNPAMIAVPGRVLNGPDVKYSKPSSLRPFSASWNMRDAQLMRPATLNRWSPLLITPAGSNPFWSSSDLFKDTINVFTEALRRIGMGCSEVQQVQMIRCQPTDPEGKIDEAIRNYVANKDTRPQLILVVLPSRDATVLYNKVKYACDVKYGVRNVCVVDSKLAKIDAQYFTNVGLKINLKLGGWNHTLEPARLGLISAKETMIMGIDVTHPSPGSASNAPSVAAVVASIDAVLGQWPAVLNIQKAREEMVQALGEMIKTRLNLWRTNNNNRLPRNILVYRDGVSEGQYQLVLDKELVAIKQACQEIYPASDTKTGWPRISILIVGKRHHTRFYATQANNADRSGNPSSGTIVDRGVTEGANWDFFLQAHSSLQGTARPAHYFVVHDEIFQNQKVQLPFQHAADLLEDLTHNLCYLFGRATKAVSLCPPAYYADLACERARCYLADAFAPSGSDSASATSSSSEVHSVELHERVKDTMFYI